MWSVLEAIYDGPIDTVDYQPVPVILDKIPNTADGSLTFQPIPVSADQIVIDVDGNPVNLKAGVKVFPSGCTSGNCAITWDGVSALSMDRMVANFVIKSGILWSDGQPLTADDSVYSFQIASDPATPVTKKIMDQTDTYKAMDVQTVQWISKPGLVTRNINYYFWTPLPKHAWQALTAAELQTAAESNLKLLGWGAYMIDEWTPGDHIRLVKNPNYFRAKEGLPYFDTLVYRFVSENADSNLQALTNGECDIADQSVAWEQQYATLRDGENAKKILVYRGLGPEWEHLDFNIKPASYDDGYTIGTDRPDFFGDVRVRQAFAYCIDRPGLVKNLFKNLTEVPLSYLPPNHPDYTNDLAVYSYDIEKGKSLLDEAGWIDLDHNDSTPRTAQGVTNVVDGTAFSITLTTSQADLRKQAAQEIASDLGKCGIQVTLNSVTRSELYAAAPDGVVFGRQYDLAEFAWSAGLEPPCFIYETDEIATVDNHWRGTLYGGLNSIGFSNSELDTACKAAQSAGLDTGLIASNQKQIQKILAEQVPSIPLFYFVSLAVSRPDLCGLKMDVSSRSEFSSIESINYGPGCQK
jgi:peptide/nickel transport system substrate-binding protein